MPPDEAFWARLRKKDYDGLLDFLDFAIQTKLKQPMKCEGCLDIYQHLQTWLRIQQLAMNHAKAQAEACRMAVDGVVAVLASPEQKIEIAEFLEKRKKEEYDKLMARVEERGPG